MRGTEPGLAEKGSLAARLLVLSSALPYLALPLGASTNLPLSTLLAGWLLLRNLHRGRILACSVVLLLVPLLASGVRMFVSPEPFSVSGQLTWIFYLLPLPAMAVAVLVLRRKILPWLAWTITASAAIAMVQKYLYLDRGIVPWLWAYDAPGYASVRDLAPVLAEYVRRPFGLFPESSFMAGTLAMMAMGMLLLERRLTGALRPAGLLAVGSACAAIAVSGSGTSLVSLGLIAATALWPLLRSRPLIAVYALPLALGGALWFGLVTLGARNDSFNWSWADRTASLLGSLRLLLSDPGIFLLGIGRGSSTLYFSQARVPLLGLDHYNQLTDIFSVLGRIVLENGVLFGLPLVLWMGLVIATAGGRRRPLSGLAALLCWLVAAGVAISYDSAFWIFGMPGLLYGLSLVDSSTHLHPAGPSRPASHTPSTLPPRENHAHIAYR